MNKVLLSLWFFCTMAFSDTALLLKRGWQLVGSSITLENMSKFKAETVEQVWYFDARTQKWLGYSPNTVIQAKMESAGIAPLKKLENWHGFWVKSSAEWALVLEESSTESIDVNSSKTHDTIVLQKGWNLLSLPIDSVVSADIFEGMTVWKYNAEAQWELFDTINSEASFLSLGHIKNSDGFWVKAEENTTISILAASSKLNNFATVSQMERAIKEMALVNARPYCGIFPVMRDTLESADVVVPTVTNSAEATNTSTTNLQESGVDESDSVKHNGQYIFYIDASDYQNNSLNMTTFERLAKGESRPLKRIALQYTQAIEGMYLNNNRLVILSRQHNEQKQVEGEATEESSTPPSYSYEAVNVEIVDIADIADIHTVNTYTIDGSLVTSRIANNILYLVSSFIPKIAVAYPKVYISLPQSCEVYFSGVQSSRESDYVDYAHCYEISQEYESGRYYRYDYDSPNVIVQDLMPEIEGNSMPKQPLITPKQLYASAKRNQSTALTTVTSIDVLQGSYQKSNSFMGDSTVEYASTGALYLVSHAYPSYYDFSHYKERSTIYKFHFDANLSYGGLGAVYGHVLNQFALSEYQTILRIATTEGLSWWNDATNNSVYTLKEQEGFLSIEGILSGLGKEGEEIKSVRFMGARGYVVTFRQTDPLYTLELSNPKAPQKMGELEVSGYSSYLHPIGEDKLLGIGQDADANGMTLGVKIELFDVSDMATPTSLDSIVLTQNSSSELESNHKALAYRSSDNLFAFPYREWSGTTNLGIYKIQENLLTQYTPITNRLSSGWGEHRGLIFDQNETTYISFFANGTVVTEKLHQAKE